MRPCQALRRLWPPRRGGPTNDGGGLEHFGEGGEGFAVLGGEIGVGDASANDVQAAGEGRVFACGAGKTFSGISKT